MAHFGARLLLFAAIFFALCITFFIIPNSFNNTSLDDKDVSVIIFKIPRSGSSWFTELMNNVAPVFISKEIIQGGDVEKFSTEEKETHLHKSLVKPTGKLASSRSIFHGFRFIEDYIIHRTFKIAQRMNVLGFTLNPEHCEGVDWNKILPTDRETKIIIYARSNLVKTAISGIRGTQMKQLCGRANRRSDDDGCKIPDRVDLDTHTFASEVARWKRRNEQLFRYRSLHPALARLPATVVYYEELQHNVLGTLQRVLRFLRSDYTASQLDERWLQSATGGRRAWAKRSSEDLSKHISSFPTIDAALLAAGPQQGQEQGQRHEQGLDGQQQTSSDCRHLRAQLLEQGYRLHPPFLPAESRSFSATALPSRVGNATAGTISGPYASDPPEHSISAAAAATTDRCLQLLIDKLPSNAG